MSSAVDVRFRDDHVAVVTGSAQGIGLEIARVLGASGAHVVIADLGAERVNSAVATLVAAGIRAVGVECNVTEQEQVEEVSRRAIEEFGRIDTWVNNAGITRDASMRNLTLDDFRLVVDVTLAGSWLGTRTAAGVMREQHEGSIINISSIAGKAGNAGQTNYSAAKAGIVGLTKAAAKEVAAHNVRVNAIQPGLIRTPMTAAMAPEVFAERERDIPLKRAGEPEEVAKAVLFLSSDLSSFITGAVIEVSGGRLM